MADTPQNTPQNTAPAPAPAAPAPVAADASTVSNSSPNPPAAQPAGAAETLTSQPAPVAVETKPAEAPKADAAPAEAPKGDAPAEAKPETFLGQEDAKTEGDKTDAKTAEAPKAEAEPAKDGQPAEQAPLPSYDAWTLPEGVTVDETRIGEFNKMLGELEITGKLPHDVAKKYGQQLVEFGIAEVTTALTRQAESYLNAWTKTKSTWAQEVQKDPQFASTAAEPEKFQGAVKTLRAAISEFAGTPEQAAEFRQLMEQSGIGSHRAQFRVLLNMHNEISRLRGMLESEQAVRQLAGQKPQPAKQGKIQKFYKNSNPSK